MNGLPINVTDLVILAVLLLSGLLAFLRGFVAEVLSDRLRSTDPGAAAPAMFRAFTRYTAGGSPP